MTFNAPFIPTQSIVKINLSLKTAFYDITVQSIFLFFKKSLKHQKNVSFFGARYVNGYMVGEFICFFNCHIFGLRPYANEQTTVCDKSWLTLLFSQFQLCYWWLHFHFLIIFIGHQLKTVDDWSSFIVKIKTWLMTSYIRNKSNEILFWGERCCRIKNQYLNLDILHGGLWTEIVGGIRSQHTLLHTHNRL